MKTLTYTGELVVTTCWCGIKLAVPQSLYDYAQQSEGNAIYCPLGHQFVFTESEATRLQKRLDRERASNEFLRTSRQAAWDQAHAAERSARAYKGHLTRVRNKVANGVCPVAGCHRHFDNVQAHIANQHPDWAVIDPETGKAATL